MVKKEYDGLAALGSLRSKLDASSSLDVLQEGGYCWKAHFLFGHPAKGEDIEAMKRQLHLPLPPAYEQFLHKWTAAARSFDDWLDRLVVAQGAKYWRWS